MNAEHVKIAKQGFKAMQAWAEANPDKTFDLSGATFVKPVSVSGLTFKNFIAVDATFRNFDAEDATFGDFNADGANCKNFFADDATFGNFSARNTTFEKFFAADVTLGNFNARGAMFGYFNITGATVVIGDKKCQLSLVPTH